MSIEFTNCQSSLQSEANAIIERNAGNLNSVAFCVSCPKIVQATRDPKRVARERGARRSLAVRLQSRSQTQASAMIERDAGLFGQQGTHALSGFSCLMCKGRTQPGPYGSIG